MTDNLHKEWYRGSCWSRGEQAFFYEKLNAARESSRSQYLHIKAYYLLEARKKNLARCAITLLEQAQSYSRPMLSLINYYLGNAYVLLGDHKQALRCYQYAISLEETSFQPGTQSKTELLLLVAEKPKLLASEEVLRIANLLLSQVPLFLEGAFSAHLARAVVFDRENSADMTSNELITSVEIYNLSRNSIGKLGIIDLKNRKNVIKIFLKLVKKYRIGLE